MTTSFVYPDDAISNNEYHSDFNKYHIETIVYAVNVSNQDSVKRAGLR